MIWGLPIFFSLLTYMVSPQKLLPQIFEFLWRRCSFLRSGHQFLRAQFLFLDVTSLAFTYPFHNLEIP